MRKTSTVDQAIEVLNRIHKADPSVLPALIEFRVPCNRAIVDDPTVQVGVDPETMQGNVGLLGILNGVFGIRKDGWGFIAAEIDDEGKLTRFKRTSEVR